MINHILLICSSIIIYEFLKYLNFTSLVKSNLKIYKKIIKLFRYKNISDFRKEKLILNYSKSLFIISVKIITILIPIIIFVIILNSMSNKYINYIISILGMIELIIIFLIYHFIRNKYYAKL